MDTSEEKEIFPPVNEFETIQASEMTRKYGIIAIICPRKSGASTLALKLYQSCPETHQQRGFMINQTPEANCYRKSFDFHLKINPPNVELECQNQIQHIESHKTKLSDIMKELKILKIPELEQIILIYLQAEISMVTIFENIEPFTDNDHPCNPVDSICEHGAQALQCVSIHTFQSVNETLILHQKKSLNWMILSPYLHNLNDVINITWSSKDQEQFKRIVQRVSMTKEWIVLRFHPFSIFVM